MKTFSHSVGIYVIDGTGDLHPYFLDENVSFRLSKNGQAEVLGFGANGGRFPDFERGPMNSDNLTTVLVEDDSPATRVQLRALIEQHLETYKECRLEAWPEYGSVESLTTWVKSGAMLTVPEGDEDDEPDPERNVQELPNPEQRDPKWVAQQEEAKAIADAGPIAVAQQFDDEVEAGKEQAKVAEEAAKERNEKIAAAKEQAKKANDKDDAGEGKAEGSDADTDSTPNTKKASTPAAKTTKATGATKKS